MFLTQTTHRLDGSIEECQSFDATSFVCSLMEVSIDGEGTRFHFLETKRYFDYV